MVQRPCPVTCVVLRLLKPFLPFVGSEAQLAEARRLLDCLTDKLHAILAAFEPSGVAMAEDLAARLEAARGRLRTFMKKVAGDAIQYTMGLVKSHLAEADLEPVGDGIPPECSNEEWEAYLASAKPLADRITADLDLYFVFICTEDKWLGCDKNNIYFVL